MTPTTQLQGVAVISVRKPTPDALRAFLSEQTSATFSYEAVGATATTPPDGYDVDRTRVKLGEGETVFQSACAALRRWEQFQLGWVEAWPRDSPLVVGQAVAVMGRGMGCWWLNACRIVYVIEESGPVNKFGFAYGTLPAHVESGEEKFSIEWDRGADTVWYDILAFSKPNRFVARLGYPFVRRFQSRFRRDSAASMARAVQEAK